MTKTSELFIAEGGTGKSVAAQDVRAMIAIIVISVLALIGAAFAIYFWQRSPSDASSACELPPLQFGGLFANRGPAAATTEPERDDASKRRVELIDRARVGDLNALSAARSTAGAKAYGDVLNTLIDWASERQESLLALVSHISKSDELRANRRLAKRLIEIWKVAPNRRLTTDMIHIAALSDDAATYQRAVEQAVEFWRRGKLAEFRAEELTELFVTQFWVIAPEARRGGEGFALKRKLSAVRRELAAAKLAG